MIWITNILTQQFNITSKLTRHRINIVNNKIILISTIGIIIY